MNLSFTPNAWGDYQYWVRNDKRVLSRINELIRTIQCDPFEGIGKPQRLRNQLQGHWSRRINDEHQLVYTISDDSITIVACRFHY